MTDNQADPTQDSAMIEREIRQTQDDMSRTVDRIGDQLTPRSIMNALFDKADAHDIDARTLLDGARRNPLALAMIAGGAIWLVSDSDAKLPKMPSFDRKPGDRSSDSDHRDYIAHMDRVEWRDGEAIDDYQRRRDMARANYFIVERGNQEDDQTFRERLDVASEKFREKREAWGDRVQSTGEAMRSRSRTMANGASDLFRDNPLVGGLLAAAAGAIAGTSLPMTKTEDEKLSDVGHNAREIIGEQKDQLTSAAQEKKNELVSMAEQQSNPPESGPGHSSGSRKQTDEIAPAMG